MVGPFQSEAAWRVTIAAAAAVLSAGAARVAGAIAALLTLLFAPINLLGRMAKALLRGLFYLLLILSIPLVVGYGLLRTERDVVYRYAGPDEPACNAQDEWPITLAHDVATLDNDQLGRLDNDELAAISRNPALKRYLTCIVQYHEVEAPKDNPSAGPVRFYLGFAEFAESGSPAEVNAAGEGLEKRQVQVIVDHLRAVRSKGRHNYVIAFIHGWRHNASIGDTDVQKLRVMAAYTASFLRQRCAAIKRGCDTDVTAVYFGWRGARVDETFFTRHFGPTLGTYPDTIFGVFPALLTLFDRKPVSERISASAITALRFIDEVASNRQTTQKWKQDSEGRMITFGHSLGGNMLAAGLREIMTERVARHTPGEVMTAPIGDLIVLLNPASEAWNWTSIQRAMRERVQFTYTTRDAQVSDLIEREAKQIDAGHLFFPKQQPPIYISLGSADTWPAGGIRRTDLKYLKKLISGEKQKRAEKQIADERQGGASTAPGEHAQQQPTQTQGTCEQMAERRRILLHRPRYDWATHDLFPAFRFDFRAAAETLENIARGSPDICDVKDQDYEDEGSGWPSYFAAFLRNFPFMNTDVEQTRTIGHLIPIRSPLSSLAGGPIQPASIYGTTHELTFDLGAKDARFTLASYRKASDPHETECAIVDHWLWQARTRAGGVGMYWDSASVGPDKPALTPVQRPREDGKPVDESQFRHGLSQSGMAAIVRANDPFWNVRVFETGMQDHGEYTSYPLICAIQQLVMDKVGEPDAAPGAGCAGRAADGVSCARDRALFESSGGTDGGRDAGKESVAPRASLPLMRQP